MAQIQSGSQTQQPDGAEHLDATPARQGLRGMHVLWLLIVSFIAAAGALALAWAWRSGDLGQAQQNTKTRPAEAQSFDSTVGPARQK